MSQEYTPVEWVDETPEQMGTLINKARLDQMQSAHHFADGFEEVDAVPTADPGVDYHKIVYCTADKQFYRWTGTAWEKDIDDDTKALLLAHEADHANPHVVTKAQVGLGNVDNKGTVSSWQSTTDNDHIPTEKLVKDSLDAKVDDTQIVSAWQDTPDNDHIPTEKLTKDTIDGKVSGTGNIGDDTKPIKIVNGVATAVTNDLVDVSSAQTITGAKTIKGDIAIGEVGTPTDVTQVGDLNIKGNITIEGNITQNGSSYETHAEKIYTTKDYIYLREGATGALSPGDYTGMEAEKYDGTNNGRLAFDSSGTARVGDVGDEQPLLTRDESASLINGNLLQWNSTNQKAVDAGINTSQIVRGSGNIGDDTKPIKIVNGRAVAVANDFMTTSTNQVISGNKTYQNTRLRLNIPLANVADNPSTFTPSDILVQANNGDTIFKLRFENYQGRRSLYCLIIDLNGVEHAFQLASYTL